MRPLTVLALLVPFAMLSVRADDPPEQVRPVRVLLMSSAASREYQFLRSTLQSAGEKQKITLTQLLFSVDGKEGKIVERGDDKILTVFPETFEPNPKEKSAEAAALNLASYDAIVALDPDWTKLSADQQGLLRKWVEKGSGLVVLAGDIHTPSLASPAKREALKTIRELLPVEVDDPRLKLLGDRAESRTLRLTLTDAGKEQKWLRLGDEEPDKGWSTFHAVDKQDKPTRGFYRAFPVAKVKPAAKILANLEREPYVVQAKVGDGQAVFVASQELWRLRQAQPTWYDKLWVSLIRQTAGK
jgi:hypothetical protein